MTGKAFLCAKCSGTGIAHGGKCYTCRGQGGWSKSPQQREAARLATKQKRERDAQRANLESKVYAIVDQLDRDSNATARGMMEMHRAGKQWTANQIFTIRAIRNGRIHGNQIARRVERAAIVDEGDKS